MIIVPLSGNHDNSGHDDGDYQQPTPPLANLPTLLRDLAHDNSGHDDGDYQQTIPPLANLPKPP